MGVLHFHAILLIVLSSKIELTDVHCLRILYCIAFEHLYSASNSIKIYRSVLLVYYSVLVHRSVLLVFIRIYQAYVLRIFSLSGLLTDGNGNRMSQNLEMSFCET